MTATIYIMDMNKMHDVGFSSIWVSRMGRRQPRIPPGDIGICRDLIRDDMINPRRVSMIVKEMVVLMFA